MVTRPIQIFPRPRRSGFTLVEVLISVALVLLLILGINEVFRLTSRAVGAGNAVSDITRNARDAQNVIYNDLTHADVINGPFLLLRSETAVAFRNRQDQLNDRDFLVADSLANADSHTRSIDATGSGTDTLTIPYTGMNRRVHRADILKFFARTIARRQTGDNNSFTTGIVSSEQYISYGHLRQPANPDTPSGSLLGIRGGGSNTYQSPTVNTHNFYASDWTLGRNVFLMVPPKYATAGATSGPRYMYDYSSGTPVRVTYMTRSDAKTSTPDKSAAPFTISSQSTTDGQSFNGSELVQYSYYDIAGTSMTDYRAGLKLWINAGRQSTWFTFMDYRFNGYPIPSRPLTRLGVARTVPCFVQHCTQFAVEYAGDFLAQDINTGAVNGVADGAGHGTDGLVDFAVDPVTKKHTIRWYGFPRNVTRDDIVDKNDVVPLRDIAGGPLPFERVLPTTNVPTTALGYAQQGTLSGTSAYECVWGPDTDGYPKPKMLRITMAIDDPSGRLTEEQYFEYIVELP